MQEIGGDEKQGGKVEGEKGESDATLNTTCYKIQNWVSSEASEREWREKEQEKTKQIQNSMAFLFEHKIEAMPTDVEAREPEKGHRQLSGHGLQPVKILHFSSILWNEESEREEVNGEDDKQKRKEFRHGFDTKLGDLSFDGEMEKCLDNHEKWYDKKAHAQGAGDSALDVIIQNDNSKNFQPTF